MAIRKNKIKDKKIIRIRDSFYINLDEIDCIELVSKHPSDNSTLNPPKYCIRYRNSYYNWSLISIEDFKKYLEPYI